MPFWNGRIDELGSRSSQTNERRDFLHCGKRPRKGQRTETILNLEKEIQNNDGFQLPLDIRLSGVVTQVGRLPSFSEWIEGSHLPKRIPKCGYCKLQPIQPLEKDDLQLPPSCPDPDCYTNKVSFKGGTTTFMQSMMARTLLLHGTLHSQEVTVYAHLSTESHQELSALKYDATRMPYQAGQVYKVSLVAQDSFPVFEWKVKAIEDVTHMENFEDLPEEFRDYAFGKLSPMSPSSPRALSDTFIEESELQQFLNDIHNERMDIGLQER